MPGKDPRIDAYIAKSAEFARPILIQLRKAMHAACPGVEETLKWSAPTFMYKGMLGGMAAFKQHCAFGFWKHKLLADSPQASAKDRQLLEKLGRITNVKDLPPAKAIEGLIKKAAKLNEDGVKLPTKKRAAPKKLVVPPHLTAALKKNKKAAETFANFSYSHQKEYVEWLTEAKTEETRLRRLATALEWMAQGKSRNWKYQRC